MDISTYRKHRIFFDCIFRTRDRSPVVPPDPDRDLMERVLGQLEGGSLEEILEDLVKKIENPKEVTDKMANLCATIKQVFVSDFPEVEVEPYGSFARYLNPIKVITNAIVDSTV